MVVVGAGALEPGGDVFEGDVVVGAWVAGEVVVVGGAVVGVTPRADGPALAEVPPARRPMPAASPPPSSAIRAAPAAREPWAANVRRSISVSTGSRGASDRPIK